MKSSLLAAVLSMAAASSLSAKEIVTNNIQFSDAPDWVTTSMVETVTGRVQNFLEWDIRRVKVRYHAAEATYRREHNLGFETMAFFRRSDQSVHLSPRVTKVNFDPIFAHELVHVVFHQKYKEAIPRWLEEGLANHIGRAGTVDYPWLSKQAHGDVTQLSHPDRDISGSKYHYTASTALIEMISGKCSLTEVLRLSVGAKMETYLGTYCEIKDINASFREWVAKKSTEKPGAKPAKKKWF